MIYTVFFLFILLICVFCFNLSGIGWRAAIRPADHPVANFEFDVVVGADGRRNTLEGEKTANKRGEQMPQGLKSTLYSYLCLIKEGTVREPDFPIRAVLEPIVTLKMT